MIKLFVGPMGSGKSEKLLIHLHEKLQDRIPVVCLKPEIDTRAKNEIRSRNGNFHKAIFFTYSSRHFVAWFTNASQLLIPHSSFLTHNS